MSKYEQLSEKLSSLGISAKSRIMLSGCSTFHIGGEATLTAYPEEPEQIIATLRSARELDIPVLTVGNGSNILFSDSGFDGLVVITNKCSAFSVDKTTVTAECGMSFTRLATVAKDASLSGIEFAYGIPGTVGGAVYMNAGAYGGEVANCLVSATVYDSDSDTVTEYSKEDCQLGYRKSIFLNNPRLTVLSASFELTPGDRDAIREKMSGFMQSRKEKQPLEYPNAGSTFKRPEGHFAGKLIEDAGLKGFRIGDAEVSVKHAGFVINRGNATSDDVIRLIEHIKNTVYNKYGVTLECEIKIVK